VVSRLFYQHKCITVVKELRSKMFRQHPGYHKTVFKEDTDDYRQFL